MCPTPQIFVFTWAFVYQDYEEDEEDDDDDEDDTGMGDEGDDSNEGTGSADGNDGYEADDAEVTGQNFDHALSSRTCQKTYCFPRVFTGLYSQNTKTFYTIGIFCLLLLWFSLVIMF